jgi:predicted nucleic acid-binding protein
VTVLLDANVLIALLVDDHVYHAAAENWFVGLDENFATCPITQGSLMRLLIREGQQAATARAILNETTAGTNSGLMTSHTPMFPFRGSSAIAR